MFLNLAIMAPSGRPLDTARTSAQCENFKKLVKVNPEIFIFFNYLQRRILVCKVKLGSRFSTFSKMDYNFALRTIYFQPPFKAPITEKFQHRLGVLFILHSQPGELCHRHIAKYKYLLLLLGQFLQISVVVMLIIGRRVVVYQVSSVCKKLRIIISTTLIEPKSYSISQVLND